MTRSSWQRCFALVLACLLAGVASGASAQAEGGARDTELLAPGAFPDDPQPAEPAQATDAAPSDAAPSDAEAIDAPPAAPGAAPARPRAVLPRTLAVRIERCATPPFELDALAHVLDIELVALGIGEPLSEAARPAVLTLSLPACGDELRIELQGRGQLAVDTLRVSDFEGVGRERALALATIERLAPLWAQVLDAASQPQPLPVEEPPAPRAPELTRELHAAFGVGFIGAPSYEARLTLAYQLSGALYLDVSLFYATEAGRTILAQVITSSSSSSLNASVDAHAILAHAGFEGRVGDGEPVHLFVGSGLSAGGALADGDVEGAPLPASQGHLAPSQTTAPVVLTNLGLGLRVALGSGVLATARVEARYVIVGPKFSAIDVTVIDWTGLGLCAGIGIGYGF